MATLAEALATVTAKNWKCAFRDWVATFTDEDRTLLNSALTDLSINDSELTRRLALAGCPVGVHRVADHRYGRCKACG